MLPRSTPTSANGTCQVWRTWPAVGLSLPIVDSGGSFVVFIWSISHLTLSSFSSQTQQPLLVLRSSMPTSRSGTCQAWHGCEAVRLFLPIVDSCGSFVVFIWSISHLTLSSFSSQTQQPFLMLKRSTPTSASGTCQERRTWMPVSLSLPIVDSGGSLLFLFGPFHIWPFLLSPPKHNSLSRCFLVQRRHQPMGRVKCDKPGPK